MGFFLHLPKQDIKNMVKLSWKTEKRLIKDLMLSDINPRKISPEQKEALTKSLEKFNLADIPVLNTDNTIISGNQRLQILYDLGKGSEEIDVRVPNRKLSETELKEYMLIANTHAGVFDVELLEAHFEDVNIDFDIQLVDDNGKITVKGHERLKEGLTDDDEVPEPPKIAKSKPGQIWILGSHRLMCGDSTKKSDVQLLMEGKKADMVFTDPPYNVAYEGKTKDSLKIQNDDMSSSDFRSFLDLCFSCMFLQMNEGAPIYVTCPLEDGNFQASFMSQGFKLQSILVWVKNTMVMGRKDYHYKHEPIIYGWKPGGAHFWKGGRDKTSVINCDKPPRNGEHPTMKPVELIENLFDNSLRNDAVVMDLFGGSGSTLIACENKHANARLMELDPKYCDVIIKRWQDFTGQKAILEATGQEFDSL